MGISLRKNEKLIVQADFHWWSYKFSILWCGFCCIGAFGNLIPSANGSRVDTTPSSIFGMIIMGIIPIGFRLLQNKCKHYVLTNERLYIEHGILSKNKKDINLSKINDIELSQSLFKRIVGTGDVIAIPSDGKPLTLNNITSPETFKNQVSNMIGKRSRNAA